MNFEQLRRRDFVALLGGAVAWPIAARAQQPPTKIRRIGMLMPVSSAAASLNIEAFRQGLRERGYVEGQNIVIEYRYADGKVEPLRDFAAELVGLQVDVIVTWGTPAAQAAEKATSTIPIVMAAALDPVGTGLVASLARPGRNVTGVTVGYAELGGKNLELLKEIAPGVGRVAVLLNPDNPAHALMLRENLVAARALDLQVQILEVRDAGGLDRAFAAITRERADAIAVVHDLLFLQYRKRFADFAAKSRLPAMYDRREYADAGGLMAYGPNFLDNFRHAASFVDRILNGANPADLPVENPTKYELILNSKAARALGLMIPQSILLRADEVIE